MELFNQYVDEKSKDKIGLCDDVISIVMSYMIIIDKHKNMLYDGKLEGNYVRYYGNGIKCEEGYYHNGLKQGLYTIWFYDGNILERCMYEDGLFHGLREEFQPDGSISIKCTYVKDKQHGKSILYNNEGLILEDCDYVNGNVVKYNPAEKYTL